MITEVYKNTWQWIRDLKDKIIHLTGEIESELCQNVIGNFKTILDIYGVASGVRYFFLYANAISDTLIVH